jgi:hypothetical protein
MQRHHKPPYRTTTSRDSMQTACEHIREHSLDDIGEKANCGRRT